MRLIDADALMKYIAVIKEELEDMLDEYPKANHIDSHERTKIYISIEDINTFKEMVEEAPTVERPRGEWIFYAISAQSKTGGIDETLYKCSNCGAICNGKPRFCAGCYAEMRGEGE